MSWVDRCSIDFSSLPCGNGYSGPAWIPLGIALLVWTWIELSGRGGMRVGPAGDSFDLLLLTWAAVIFMLVVGGGLVMLVGLLQ